MKRLTNSGTKEAKSNVTIGEALNRLAEYEDLEERLQTVYGECDGMLEKVVEHLERHEDVALPDPTFKARLLTDAEVDRWEEFKCLEEQGNLLKLPCAVGDTVYHVCAPKNEKPQIIEMKVGCVEPCGAIRDHKGVCEAWNVYAETDYTKEYFRFFDFGKSVFLTRGEAEAAWKELEGH